MKKHLLISLFTLLSLGNVCADVVIDESTFPDYSFRSFLTSQWYGVDGKITNEEIASIKGIFVIQKNIESLRGIEYFSALTELNCDINQLTSLDVSKNTALTSLFCNQNRLTSLDVSKNTALTCLSCGGNQLTSLDVSKNTTLNILWCESNQLTSLDVSKNTALDDLIFAKNQLTSVDVSKNTALNNMNCENNQLTSVDVSKNTTLASFFCGGNLLTSLDISKNTALKTLRCECNKIEGTDMDVLIENLPIGGGTIFVINNINDYNVMTTVQVKAAKAKNWRPLYTVNGESWFEYNGSQPTSIDFVKEDKNNLNPYYDLNGRKLDGVPTQKGVYIQNGKKVVIK